MTRFTRSTACRLGFPLLTAALLSACGGNDDNNGNRAAATVSYEVRVTNATNGQPLTPVAVVAHSADYHPWTLGSAASTGLEMLAEGGDVSQFISDAEADPRVAGTASSTNGPFGPGAVETVELVLVPEDGLQISVASMLANTNDAFTGVANVAVDTLGQGESLSLMARVYDAGTEANTETTATMPGPAAGGEGFNATRDTGDFVSVHAGVVTADDGLASSALDESHRWSGPAASITVTRIR